MRKIIFAINITVDGFADHTAVIADDELHDFFTNLLNDIDISLMGRKTYQLMENFWPVAYDDPASTKSMIKFADKYNPMKKIIFSNTLTEVNWENSRLADKNLRELVLDLKNQNGKNISAGSLSIASQLLKMNLIDEYWFLVHPIILGKGKKMFDQSDGSLEDFNKRLDLKLVDTKSFKSGVVVLHYKLKR